MGRGCVRAQRGAGREHILVQRRVDAIMYRPSVGLGADVPLLNLELGVDMSWPKLELGTKKNITPFWVVTSCDDLLNRIGL